MPQPVAASRPPRVLVVDGDRDLRDGLATDLARCALTASAAPPEAAAVAAVRLRAEVVVAKASDTWTRPAQFASLRRALPACALVVIAHLFDVVRVLDDASVVLTLPCDTAVVAAAVRLSALHANDAGGTPGASGTRIRVTDELLLVVGPRGVENGPWLARVGNGAAKVVVACSTLRAAIVLDALVAEGRAPSVIVHPTGDGESLRRLAARHHAKLQVVA